LSFADAGASLYAANESSPSAQPSATGANAIAIGDGAVASGADSVALGDKAYASGADSFAFGSAINNGSYGALAEYAIAIGRLTTVNASYGVAIGHDQNGNGAIIGGSGGGAVALGASYANGQNAFAAGIGDNNTGYGAKADESVAIGKRATVTGANGIAIGGHTNSVNNQYGAAIGGRANTVSGSYSVAIGGEFNYTDQDYGFASGKYAKSKQIGSMARASGRFSSSGDAQGGYFVLRSDTTDATAEALTTNNSSAAANNQIVLENESAMTFTGTVVVREDATDGDDYAGWEIKGVIMRQGQVSDTTLGVGIVNSLYHTSGLANAAVALSADTTYGGLKIQVTGIASTNLNWVATVHTSEVVNA